MRVHRIHIRGLKSLSDIKLDFDSKADATFLFANNGIGKTTILEAISLIGHTSCMRRVLHLRESSVTTVDMKPSLLCQTLAASASTESLTTVNGESFSLLRTHLQQATTLDAWFQSSSPNPDYAVIKYHVTLMEGIQDIEFYIAIRKAEYDFGDGPRDLTITKALSRNYPDDELNDLMAIISDQPNASKLGQLRDAPHEEE